VAAQTIVQNVAVTTVGRGDVRFAAEVCVEALKPLIDADWARRAGDLDWSARHTLEHIVEGLGFYARDLATPVLSVPPHEMALVCAPDSAVAGLVDGLVQMAAVVSAVVASAPLDLRAFHPAGMADRTGFAAMACDEMLVHTGDITAGLEAPFAPPGELCDRVLARLFPWEPHSGDPWQRLLWANGRTALPGRPRLGPGWTWHAAPLSEAVVTVRQEQAGDEDAIRAVHLSAFETGEEAHLVKALRDSDAFIPELSLVAVDGGDIVGHVLLTRVDLEGDQGGPALALAPIGVREQRQGEGIGWMLTWAAIERAQQLGESLVVLVGHSAYYPRFGFVQAAALGIESPMEVPREAWMALVLGPDHPRGTVRYPEAFGALQP
jgi:predicted N-acetyltransferase YhbS